MEDINEIAEKLKAMSDAELDDAIRRVGAAMGLNGRKLDRLTREKGALKRKLEKADERDLQKLKSMLTPDQVETIKKSVEGK